MRKPAPIAKNRSGLSFGRTPPGPRYASGRRISGYYTMVCLRCGWAFKPPRHRRHRLADCDAILAEATIDPLMRQLIRRNLYGMP